MAFQSELKARVVAHNWNPSTLEGEGEWSQVPGHSETPPPPTEGGEKEKKKRERKTDRWVKRGRGEIE